MKIILTVAGHELRAMYRRRMFQIVTLGLPVVGLVALIGIWFFQNVVDDEADVKQVGYVDGTSLFTGHQKQGGLEFVVYQSPELGMRALLDEDVERLYVIRPTT